MIVFNEHFFEKYDIIRKFFGKWPVRYSRRRAGAYAGPDISQEAGFTGEARRAL
jgi:hypothetical protein